MKVSREMIQRAREDQLRFNAIRMCILAFALVMNAHGYGDKRLPKLIEEIQQTILDYRGRYDEVSIDAMEKHAREKGIEVDWI